MSDETDLSLPQAGNEKPAHLWKPGQSGNPAGRPRGGGRAHELREQIRACVPDVVAKLVEQAKEGDVGAARLLLERVLAPIKSVELAQAIDLPAAADLADKGRAVLQAAADGLIPASYAASLITAIGSLARVVETDELVRRIAALEGKNGKS